MSGDTVCPRCGAAFHCGVDGAAPCPCVGVALDAAALARLAELHRGCLCLACLRTIAESAEAGAVLRPAGLGGEIAPGDQSLR